MSGDGKAVGAGLRWAIAATAVAVGYVVAPPAGRVVIFAVVALLAGLLGYERDRARRALRRLAERERVLVYQANHDPLTGLPNRALLLDRLSHALARSKRSGGKLGVVFLDLDGFKLVNDEQGHEAGDLLLAALTPRLTGALRPGDTIARFGGDEFVVLCEDLDSGEDAVGIAERVCDACMRPILVGDHAREVSVSAGVVVVERGAATPADILREADAAMYRATAHGHGHVEVAEAAQVGQAVPSFAKPASMSCSA
jgi:diguanylate cyclase (GGDEF)-like protein